MRAAGGPGTEYVDHFEAPGCSSFDDIPESMLVHDAAALRDAWADELFSPLLRPPEMGPLPPAVPRPTTDWRPRSLEELLQPAAHARLMAWLRSTVLDMADLMRRGADGPRPHKPPPLIIAQSKMVPAARGIVWDLRDKSNIKPLDTTAPVDSDLNLPFLKVLLGAAKTASSLIIS